MGFHVNQPIGRNSITARDEPYRLRIRLAVATTASTTSTTSATTSGVSLSNILRATFCKKVFWCSFSLLTVWLFIFIFLQKNISAKAACKMLVKLRCQSQHRLMYSFFLLKVSIYTYVQFVFV